MGGKDEEPVSIWRAMKRGFKQGYYKENSRDFTEETLSEYPQLDCEPRGNHVSVNHCELFEDNFDDGEKLHFVLSGFSVKMDGQGGTSDTRSSKLMSDARTAITDKRIIIKIPKYTGHDLYTVGYVDITDIGVVSNLMWGNKFEIRTGGKSYEISVDEPSPQEMREAASFVRRTKSELRNAATTNSDND
jgi:hypothetical protein